MPSFAVAGEHGGAIRHEPGQGGGTAASAIAAATPGLSRRSVWPLAHPGALLEHKARGFALHYRAAPAAGPPLREALARLLAGSAEFELLPAHMLWEVRPRGADKGKAVAGLMDRQPFRGRLPVFIGDDVTDEDGIAAATGNGWRRAARAGRVRRCGRRARLATGGCVERGLAARPASASWRVCLTRTTLSPSRPVPFRPVAPQPRSTGRSVVTPTLRAVTTSSPFWSRYSVMRSRNVSLPARLLSRSHVLPGFVSTVSTSPGRSGR